MIVHITNLELKVEDYVIEILANINSLLKLGVDYVI